ncbi:MAG: TetR family transcriptional regulator [Deltaproteobacteria bacterium]|nr:TetR family transcriptional regulator [Deltaproteobacteria bacterium]
MDVRAQILTQATRLFADQGYDGTSVQEIADELRENVLAEMLAHWNAVLPGLLLKASTEERFDATMEALSEFFIEDPDRARLFLRETLDRPEQMRAMLAQFVQPWVELLGDQLERAKEQGLVQRDVDPQAYAVEVITMAVAGTAVIDSLQVILPDDPARGSTRKRHTSELIRIARSSLYTKSEGEK